jgi:hypothetical protein
MRRNFGMTLKLNSKGNFNNYMIIPVFLFAFGIMSIIGFFMFESTIDAFEQTTIYTNSTDTTSKNAMDTVSQGYRQGLLMLDVVMVLSMVILIIGIIISSFRIKSHPAYFIVVLFMAPFLGFTSYILNYVFSEMASQSIFSSVLVYFPRTLIIGTNLHWVTLIAIVIGAISLYAKRGDQDDVVGGIGP